MSRMYVHLVFVVKYRCRVLDDDALTRLHKSFRSICADFDSDLIECNGECDHVHLLVEYPPKLSVARLVNSLKGVSSRRLRVERPDLETRRWKSNVLWSPSYFVATCGGAPIAVLRQYIHAQKRISSPA